MEVITINELAQELFENHEVRIFGTVEEPLFVANDIGKILEIKTIISTIRDFDNSEKVMHKVHTIRGNQEMTLLTEKGLYLCRCTG